LAITLFGLLTGCTDQSDSGAGGDGEGRPHDRVVRTVSLGGESVTYEVLQGKAIYQGDIILGDSKEIEASVVRHGGTATGDGVESDPDLGQISQPLVAIKDTEDCGVESFFADLFGRIGPYRWDGGVVPFRVEERSYTEQERRAVTTLMERARNEYGTQTSIRFVPWTDQPDSLVIRNFRPEENPNGAACGMSWAGRRGGQQELLLAPNADYGCLVHELGHAVGAAHEQAREDRESFVIVHYDNIEDGWGYAFDRERGCAFDDVGPYDMGSIMHYPAWAFGRDGLTCSDADRSGCTIVPRDPSISISALGQRRGLSEGDRQGLCEVYGNPGTLRVSLFGEPFRDDYTPTFVDGEIPRLELEFEWGTVRVPTDFTIVSDRDGLLASGNTSATGPAMVVALQGLSAGRHELTIQSSARCPIALVRRVDIAPELEIISPIDGRSYSRGGLIELQAQAAGLGPLGRVEWTSDLDGFLGTTDRSAGSTLRTPLTAGTHRLTARASFATGVTLTDSVAVTVANHAPSIQLASPQEGQRLCVGDNVQLLASTGDQDLDEVTVTWQLDGLALGEGHALSYPLTAIGTRILEATASDGFGGTESVSVSIVVDPCTRNPPVVAANWPTGDYPPTASEDATFYWDENDGTRWFRDLDLSVTVTETIPDSDIEWLTDRTDLQPAVIGSGRHVSVRLFGKECTGERHRITVVVRDDDRTQQVVWRVLLWQLC
jgi:astacin